MSGQDKMLLLDLMVLTNARQQIIIKIKKISHFTNLEPQDQEIGEFYVVQKRQSTDFEARKLRKGRSLS